MTDSAVLARQLAELSVAAGSTWRAKSIPVTMKLFITMQQNLPAIIRALCVMAAVEEFGPKFADIYPSAVPLLKRRADELLAKCTGAK